MFLEKKIPSGKEITWYHQNIDDSVITLVIKLNFLPFLETEWSCGGHRNYNSMHHRGFRFIIMKGDKFGKKFIQELRALVGEFAFVDLDRWSQLPDDIHPLYFLKFQEIVFWHYSSGKPKTREELEEYEQLFGIKKDDIPDINDINVGEGSDKEKESREFIRVFFTMTYGEFHKSLEALIDRWLEQLSIIVPKEDLLFQTSNQQNSGFSRCHM